VNNDMGLLDALIGAAGQTAQGQGQPAGPGAAGGMDAQMLIGVVMALVNQAGGLQGLLAKLQAGGLGEAAQSWVGTGANRPVSGEQLGGALGPDLMDLVARQMGGNAQQASGTLAELLPELIDRLTPQGQLPADSGSGGLGDLGALLGGGAGGRPPNAGDLMGMLGGLLRR
jgi:uncharacterized protein YidB (DUF937 family)